MKCQEKSGVTGPVDFTGYWCLSKVEGMDEFLRAAGFPWVVRKAALKFGGSSVDVISHSGSAMRVTSLNAKGSWTRSYDTEREVMQRNAEGTLCKTTSWWEGRVFRSRMEGSQLGVLESWRYLRGNCMAVRTGLRPAKGGPEAAMFWFFDRMETLHRHVERSGAGSLLHQIASDQRHVERATRQDTQYIQDVLLDWQRWKSPADEFIHVVTPPPLSGRNSARHSRRPCRSPGSGSPRTLSPVSISKSPSNDSLSALPAGMEVRSDARSMRSDSRSRLADSELSSSALDRVARQAAALALSEVGRGTDGGGGAGAARAAAAATANGVHAHAAAEQHRAAAAGVAAQQAQQQQGQQAQEGGRVEFVREISLSYPREAAGQLAVEPAGTSSTTGTGTAPASAPATAPALQPVRQPAPAAGPAAGAGAGAGAGLATVDSITFRPSAASSPRSAGGGGGGGKPPADAANASSPAPESDVATRGSVHGSVAHTVTSAGPAGPGTGPERPHPHHQRTASAGSAGVYGRSVHYKSLSADSTGRGGWGPSGRSTPGRASPLSTPTNAHHHLPLTPAEQLMALRLHEYDDARGIAAVVPVSTPNDTAEPQLLSMSPEQAEETAAKLRELEADMLLARQENRRGWSCGCFVLTLSTHTLPDHLRVWEMTIT